MCVSLLLSAATSEPYSLFVFRNFGCTKGMLDQDSILLSISYSHTAHVLCTTATTTMLTCLTGTQLEHIILISLSQEEEADVLITCNQHAAQLDSVTTQIWDTNHLVKLLEEVGILLPLQELGV